MDLHTVHTERFVPTSAAPTSRSPIFIGGQRRSGTTLMRACLDRHPNIVALPETHFFQHVKFRSFFKQLRTEYATLFDQMQIGGREMNLAVAAFIDALFRPQATAAGAQRWLEKSPENIRRIRYLFRLFPDAQFIHMIRDPRDTLASMKQQAATHKPYWSKFTAEVTGPEWVTCIESGEPWRKLSVNYIEIRYEHFVDEPEHVLREVLEFLREPWTDRVLQTSPRDVRDEDGNHYRPVFGTSVGRWTKDLSQEEIRSIQAIAGEKMSQLGYSPQMH